LVFLFKFFGREPLLDGDLFPYFRRWYSKAVRELKNAIKGNRLLAALNPADLVPVIATLLCELLL
jgi:hypothetical protein